MASSFSRLNLLILAIALAAVLLVTPANSQSCKSRKFTGKTYLNCSDLATLSAELHWTYTAKNNSLAVAFTAPPPSSDGWVAWGLNPTGIGMAGAQAFVAAKRSNSNGSIVVTTFNISSYSSIVPSDLSFKVHEKAAEFSGGNITIFAVLEVPKGDLASVNHLWQVGPGFNSSNGFLVKHDMKPENLNAKGTLNLASKSSAGGSESPSGSPSASATGSSAPGPSEKKKNGVGSVTASFGSLILCAMVSVLVLVSL